MAGLKGAAFLICALFMTVAVVPLVAGEVHYVVKGPQGPGQSAVTWTYEPERVGPWSAMVENYGLRWIIIDVYDNTSGFPELLMHQKIRFAAYDAYPMGVVYSYSVLMNLGRTYEITATPSGTRGSYAVVTDLTPPNSIPIADFSCLVDYDTVYVDASASFDPDGWITQYMWSWGDGTTGSGITASHRYADSGEYDVTLVVYDNNAASNSMTVPIMVTVWSLPVAMFNATATYLVLTVDASESYDPGGVIIQYAWDWGDATPPVATNDTIAMHTYSNSGTYLVTLTVMDNDGLVASIAKFVSVRAEVDEPPTASFTCSVEGFTVHVDASESQDDYGIVTYSWSWGDGTVASGVTADHTYFKNSMPSAGSGTSDGNRPPPPYMVIGYVYDQSGAPALECLVKVKNMRTGEFMLTWTDDVYGYYQIDLTSFPTRFAFGDMINVTAFDGSIAGYGQAPATDTSFLWLDVTLNSHDIPTPQVMITLWVYDGLYQHDFMTQVVTFDSW